MIAALRPALPLCVTLALAAAGCAQRDWIQGTLVTVNVSGTWTGVAVPTRAGAINPYLGPADMELTLTQNGSKVTGEGRILVTNITVEGTVHGDVVSLSATSGRLSLEATVAGDEMSGYGVSRISASASGEFRLKMSRQP